MGSNPTLSAKFKSRQTGGFSLFLGAYGDFIYKNITRLPRKINIHTDLLRGTQI